MSWELFDKEQSVCHRTGKSPSGAFPPESLRPGFQNAIPMPSAASDRDGISGVERRLPSVVLRGTGLE
jgi:hypothetical protein